jgi:iron-sulfur cluster repair protein YtfE (RIC family)
MLAQLIKKGAPEYKGLPSDLTGKVNHVKESWEKELKLHFKNEENILFPFVKGKDEELDALIDNILEEHRLIESLVKKLDTQQDVESTLDQLGKTLEGHIRKEERELFQKIQILLGEELNKLEGKIIAVKDDCDI